MNRLIFIEFEQANNGQPPFYIRLDEIKLFRDTDFGLYVNNINNYFAGTAKALIKALMIANSAYHGILKFPSMDLSGLEFPLGARKRYKNDGSVQRG